MPNVLKGLWVTRVVYILNFFKYSYKSSFYLNNKNKLNFESFKLLPVYDIQTRVRVERFSGFVKHIKGNALILVVLNIMEYHNCVAYFHFSQVGKLDSIFEGG